MLFSFHNCIVICYIIVIDYHPPQVPDEALSAKLVEPLYVGSEEDYVQLSTLLVLFLSFV